MKSLKGSQTLLESKLVELRLSVEDLTKKINDAKKNGTSMKELVANIGLRTAARTRMAALPCEIARVKKEVKRLNGHYSNRDSVKKGATKLKLTKQVNN